MILVADIGNTNVKLGIFEDNNLIENWRLSSDENKLEDEYGIIIHNLVKYKNLNKNLKAAVISSVVIPLTEVFKRAIEKYLNIPVLIVSRHINTGIELDVETPQRVGCDRIANACAAHNFYKTSSIVIDIGTATTFDVVTCDGRFIGGVIAPGIGISAESLSSFTSLLPKIKILPPENVIGKNTIQNMLSGVVRGHAAMIDGLVESIEGEIGTSVITIATGGYSSMITSYLKRPFDYIQPNLTLNGLNLIFEKNKENIFSFNK